jgi:DnaK suppressor protein
MTDAELEGIRDAILTLMEEIRASLAAHEEASRPVEPDRAIGRLTRLEAMQASHISGASLESARARLVRLDNALKRLDLDDFGICSVCEEEIPVKRLMVMPEATRCVSCAGR